jgi:hypothetical protein
MGWEMGSVEVGGVAGAALDACGPIGGHFAAAAAAVADFAVLAENVERVRAAVGAAALGTRRAAGALAALARDCG